MKAVACNLCGADDKRLLFSGHDRFFPQNRRVYTIYRCNRCGLVYLTPRPDTPAELAEIYPPGYGSYMGQRQRLLALLRQVAWQPEVREILHLTQPASPILEIGCATGEFLATLRRQGRPHVSGLEFNPAVAAVARARYGLDVQSGDLSTAQYPDGVFDLIVMRHTLEHTADPRATLDIIGRLLRPGGYAVFTIPNIDSHTARIFGRDWYGYDMPRHFYLFPRLTLNLMLKLAGLRRVGTHYVAAPNFWIGSARFRLLRWGMGGLARFLRYENPLALLLFAPLGLISALLRSSGVIRVIARKVV